MLFKSLTKRMVLIPTAALAILLAAIFLGRPIQESVVYKSTFKPQTYYVSIKKSALLSNSDLNNIARYPTVFDFRTYFSRSQLNYLHKKNSQIRILKYMNTGHMFEGGVDFENIKTNNPDWFALDINNQRVKTTSTKGYVMEPSSKGYQNWLVQKNRRFINLGYDGIHADAFYYPGFPPYSNYYSTRPVNPKTDKGYGSSEWIEAKDDLLRTLKNDLGNKLIVVNGYSNGRAYGRFGPGGLIDIADGVWIEGFVRWPFDKLSVFRSEAGWKKDIDLLRNLSAKNKLIIAETQFLQGQENEDLANQIKMYAFSSYLLGADGKSYFEFNTLNPANYWQNGSLPFKHYNLDIGEPLGEYYLKNKVYQRDFSDGKVLVNPKTEAYVLQLERNYQTLDHKRVSSIKVAPHSGVILLKHTSNIRPDTVGPKTYAKSSGARTLSKRKAPRYLKLYRHYRSKRLKTKNRTLRKRYKRASSKYLKYYRRAKKGTATAIVKFMAKDAPANGKSNLHTKLRKRYVSKSRTAKKARYLRLYRAYKAKYKRTRNRTLKRRYLRSAQKYYKAYRKTKTAYYKTVKNIRVGGQKSGSWKTYRYTGRKALYKFYVYATDIAGNKQQNIAKGSFRIR